MIDVLSTICGVYGEDRRQQNPVESAADSATAHRHNFL